MQPARRAASELPSHSAEPAAALRLSVSVGRLPRGPAIHLVVPEGQAQTPARPRPQHAARTLSETTPPCFHAGEGRLPDHEGMRRELAYPRIPLTETNGRRTA